MAIMRARHSGKSADRSTFRLMSIVIIVIGLLALVAVLQYTASELNDRRPPPKRSPQYPQTSKRNNNDCAHESFF